LKDQDVISSILLRSSNVHEFM